MATGRYNEAMHLEFYEHMTGGKVLAGDEEVRVWSRRRFSMGGS
jgi:hypothetical protein